MWTLFSKWSFFFYSFHNVALILLCGECAGFKLLKVNFKHTIMICKPSSPAWPCPPGASCAALSGCASCSPPLPSVWACQRPAAVAASGQQAWIPTPLQWSPPCCFCCTHSGPPDKLSPPSRSSWSSSTLPASAPMSARPAKAVGKCECVTGHHWSEQTRYGRRSHLTKFFLPCGFFQSDLSLHPLLNLSFFVSGPGGSELVHNDLVPDLQFCL